MMKSFRSSSSPGKQGANEKDTESRKEKTSTTGGAIPPFESSFVSTSKGTGSSLSSLQTSSMTKRSSSLSKGGTKKNGKRNQGSNWHKDISYAMKTGRWEHVRGSLSLVSTRVSKGKKGKNDSKSVSGQSKKKGSSKRKLGSFWKKSKRDNGDDDELEDSTGLLVCDKEGRTPLHVALATRKTPVDVILSLIRAEKEATRIANNKGRLPLHLAAMNQYNDTSAGQSEDRAQIIAELVDANPDALSAEDGKGRTPLSYAVDVARNNTNLKTAPKSFWMPIDEEDEEVEALIEWQEAQSERWGIVHWLLLSSATHPQTCLSIGETKPMLVDALLHAAPPAVVSLLIGASVMLLSIENRASAFAASTLYTAIARHYPLGILQSLTSQCPADVRRVRDETGMGLVSAQFISGCFVQMQNTREWSVASRIYPSLQTSIREGSLFLDDPCFAEWWEKIEFLIFFCDGRDATKNMAALRPFLLHSALRNADIPPSIIRLLLTIYPESASKMDPETGEWPIHLVAQSHDYIPRNYEFQIMSGEATASELVVGSNPGSLGFRDSAGRLPLHVAVSNGKTMASLEPFISNRHEQFLSTKDPKTGLYPFLQAASYEIDPTMDGFRWSCVARNKYSHAVWKGLADKQRAAAVVKVAETEDLERLGTIYSLLRREAGVCTVSKKKKAPASAFRDDSGMGMVSSHFLSYCYSKDDAGEYLLNKLRKAAVEDAISNARMGRLLISSPSHFVKWWLKMKFWIRYCEPVPSERYASKIRCIPRDGDERFLLHAALANPDTPPKVIELIIALHPDTVKLALPKTDWLPLHIACVTASYKAPVDLPGPTALELILNAYPEAADRVCDMGLPLELAIRVGKTWKEISCLVEEHPLALRSRDSTSFLYPFHLMAQNHTCDPARYRQFMYTARNSQPEVAWQAMSATQQIASVRSLRNTYDLLILSSTFELLRRDATVISERKLVMEENAESMAADQYDVGQFASTPAYNDDGGSSSHSTASTAAQDVESQDHETDSDDDSDDAGLLSSVHTGPSSLMKFFAKDEKSVASQRKDDVFDCDASILSGVDVMSLVSGTGHSKRSRNLQSGVETEMEEETDFSMSINDLLGDNTDFASENGSSSSSSKYSQEVAAIEEERSGDGLDQHGQDATSASLKSEESENSNDLIYFQMRREPRKSGIAFQAEGHESMKVVRLSKKSDQKSPPPRTRSMPEEIGKDSLRVMLFANERDKKNKEEPDDSVSESYHSLRPEDLGNNNASSEMMWVSTKIYDASLLGAQSHASSRGSEEDLLGASYASLRRAAASRVKRSESSRSILSNASASGWNASRSEFSRSHMNDSRATMTSISDASTTIDILDLATSESTGEDMTLTGSYSSFANDDYTNNGDSKGMKAVYDSKLGQADMDDSDSAEPDLLEGIDKVSSHSTSRRGGSRRSARTASQRSLMSIRSGTSISGSSRHSNGGSRERTGSYDREERGGMNDDPILERGLPRSLSVPILDADPTENESSQGESLTIDQSDEKKADPNIRHAGPSSDKPETTSASEAVPASPTVSKNRSSALTAIHEKQTVRSPANIQPQARVPRWSPRLGMPFVGMVSRDSIMKKNKAFAAAQKSEKTRKRRSESIDKKAAAFQSGGGPVSPGRYLGSSQTWSRSPSGTPNQWSKKATASGSELPAAPLSPQKSKLSPGRVSQSPGKPEKSPRPNTIVGAWVRSPTPAEKQMTCVLCEENLREVLMVPCRHLSICRECSVQQADLATCPLCNKETTDRMLIF